jgi:hypothetical protein
VRRASVGPVSGGTGADDFTPDVWAGAWAVLSAPRLRGGKTGSAVGGQCRARDVLPVQTPHWGHEKGQRLDAPTNPETTRTCHELEWVEKPTLLPESVVPERGARPCDDESLSGRRAARSSRSVLESWPEGLMLLRTVADWAAEIVRDATRVGVRIAPNALR